MNRSISHKLNIGLLLLLLFVAGSFQVLAQTDQKVENAVATSEESNLQKPAVTTPAQVGWMREPRYSKKPSKGWACAGEKLVGARGFEPPTPRSRTECSTRLSHAPTRTT